MAVSTRLVIIKAASLSRESWERMAVFIYSQKTRWL